MSRLRVSPVAILLAMSVLLLATPVAIAVAPGFDLLETDPGSTQFSFRDEFTIPAGFFDPGSEPFRGDVRLGGVPIETFQGQDVGDADTVVHRPQGANVTPPFPATDSVPIELVGLSLQSIQPIEVKVGSTTQLWDVQAGLSPTEPSQGQLTITKTSDQGGTFSSRLLVFPLLRFTRLSDGATRTIDTGQFHSDTQAVQDLILSSRDVPWRAGCVPPALVLPGLNEGFCPGFSIEGFKHPNIEQSRLAEHGVVPAQPRLEHFKCYAMQARRRFKQPVVQLADQFGAANARLLGTRALCVPVQKNRERLTNRTAHLACYAIRRKEAFSARKVAVRNQFGSDVLDVTAPTSLCAPSVKTRVRQRKAPRLRAAAQIDHFTCYRVSSRAQAPVRRVSLRDQFGRERVRVLQPVNLCAPARKNGGRVLHPIRHLVCYEIREVGRKFRRRSVRVTNQLGSRTVVVRRPGLLCVPSLKAPVRT